jgi:dihydroneopterin aldolase
MEEVRIKDCKLKPSCLHIGLLPGENELKQPIILDIADEAASREMRCASAGHSIHWSYAMQANNAS